jgi:hypothetical protein
MAAADALNDRCHKRKNPLKYCMLSALIVIEKVFKGYYNQI